MTDTVTPIQVDIDAAKPLTIRIIIDEITHEDIHGTFARHRLTVGVTEASC